ncbi:MAG: RHS repeat-associated core domain-containing protein [Chloroflexota bacterium]
MTCRVEDDVTYKQDYNTENRISAIHKMDGDCATGTALESWVFGYDGDGVRVSTAHFTGTTADSLTTYYFGGAYEVTGDIIRKYYSFAGQTVAVRTWDVELETWDLSYFLTDHLGSIVAVTDASGTLTSQQRYLPFGQARTDVTSPNSPDSYTDLSYTGQRALDEGMGGLMDYKARMYSSSLMRFIQPDTIIPDSADPQAWNRYSYVFNRPVNHNDPSGHDPVPCDPADGECLEYLVDELREDFDITLSQQSGKFSNDQIASIYVGVTDLANAMGGADAFKRNLGGVTVNAIVPTPMPDGSPAGGRGEAHDVDLNYQDGFDAWTVVHELAHSWDDNFDHGLSKGLRTFTLGLDANGVPDQCDAKQRLPGCNNAGYIYAGIPPAGAGKNFTLSEDFAESVTAYVYPERAEKKVSQYQGDPDYGGLYYDDYYEDNTRSVYIYAVIQATAKYWRK